MRLEFDPTLNGGLDKLNRYHRDAAVDAACRQVADGQEVKPQRWWSAARQWAGQLFRRTVPAPHH
ncbi:hypothetical protein ACFO0D_11000 [Deinococcus hohokamensis]|uniref:Uncharacterized protein n=1 Tax=Deinococcus hohokamensis TaxID=309883 RepID=A0ABV9IA94_9DEIO